MLPSRTLGEDVGEFVVGGGYCRHTPKIQSVSLDSKRRTFKPEKRREKMKKRNAAASGGLTASSHTRQPILQLPVALEEHTRLVQHAWISSPDASDERALAGGSDDGG